MEDTADTAYFDIDDVREDIALNEGILASLENDDDDDTEIEETRLVTRRTLKKLRKRLRALQRSDCENHIASQNSHSLSGPGGEAVDTTNSNSKSATHESSRGLMPPPTFDLVSRKRQRGDIDDDDRGPKSFKTTPSPSAAGDASPAPSEESFDESFYDDPILKSLFGSTIREKGKEDRIYLKSLEERRKQEEADEEFARLLQADLDQDLEPNYSQPKSSIPVSSYSQSLFRPDGSITGRSHPPQPSQSLPHPLKPEHPPFPSVNLTSDGWTTPLSISDDDSFEEISATHFSQSAGRQNGGNMARSGANYMTSRNMPGAFPGVPSYPVAGPYSGAGNSVYNYMPYLTGQSPLGYGSPSYGGLGYSGVAPSGLPGSSMNPYQLDDYYAALRDGWVDPAKTQEEIKDLLKHIRPDEELTAEQREQMPDGLKAILMPHQASGVAWMKKMEDSSSKGGVLADDMGLGKTLQAIALILARPPPADDPRPTLVVAPVALMLQWKRELEKMVRSSHRLNVLVLHGNARPVNYSGIRGYDVVLTTYGLLASELKKRLVWDDKVKMFPDARPSFKEECVILGEKSKFHRVILDEAQNVKNRSTKSAIAACRIAATYRWCLSGTPMQNNVDEMYSLIKFCRIRPYNSWDRFAVDFSRPLKGRSEAGKTKAMKQLQVLLRAILLRRTKKSEIDGKPILQLPNKTTVESRACFSKDELEFYKALEASSQIQFNKYLRNGGIGKNYSRALVLLLRLRQACCHPTLIVQSKDFEHFGGLKPIDMMENAKALSEEVIARLKELDAFECPVCMDANENPAIFPCGHALCNDCLAKLCDTAINNEEGSRPSCPHCRANIDADKCTDLHSFIRVHCPDREEVGPLDDEDEEDNSSADSSESEDDADSDDGSDLKDFIVDDDQALEYHSDDENKPGRAPTKQEPGAPKSKSKGKGKRKAKSIPKTKTLALLRKEGLRNKSTKRKYLSKLAKDWQTSAKIDKTLEILTEIRGRGQNEKTIIFSIFTSFLDLLEVPLSRDPDFGYTRYDGSMSPNERNEAVLNFTDNRRCNIMLISLKAGNAGLNLTAANNVIMLDPFWNPFVEDQAADRCYRIGQMREVTVYRVLIGAEGAGPRNPDDDSEDMDFTVEDRILRLQENKRRLVETALDETAGQNVARLGVGELGYLFGLNSLH